MGLCRTFRLNFGMWDFKYIIGTVPQESGQVVSLAGHPSQLRWCDGKQWGMCELSFQGHINTEMELNDFPPEF